MPAHRADGRAAHRLAARGAALLAIVGALAGPAPASAVSAPLAAMGGRTAADAEPGSRTPVTATTATTQLAIVVPVAAPARAAGFLSAADLAKLTGARGELTAVLDAVGTERVTLAVDPLIAASINALGDEAPRSALDWADRLDETPQDRFPLLLADADPTLLRQAGEPLPALGTVWTVPGTVSAADVTAFSEAGALRVLVADTDLAARPDPATALASIGGMGVAVVDSAVSAALDAAVAQPSPTTLGVLRRAIDGNGGRRSVVAVLGRGGADWNGLDEVLEAIRGDLGLSLVGLDALSGETAEAALVEGSQPAERLDAFRQVVAAEQADAAFAAIAADPSAIRDERRMRSYELAAVGWLGHAEWPAAVATAVERSRELRAGVRIAEADSLLLADRSSIPVSIANELDQVVTVVVTARAANGRLDIDATPIPVEVPAGARVSVSFPYVAVSNGTVAVTARLASLDGMPIGQPAVASVNVQAGWETPIAAAAAGLLLIIIVLGVIRTIRRARRLRESPAAATDAERPSDSAPGPVSKREPTDD